MKNNSLNITVYKNLLITLISTFAITGIGFLDDKIWKVIFIIIGMLAYAIVGVLLSLRIISGKKAGQKAYAAVFIVLLVFAYIVYEKLIEFKLWLIARPLWLKITVIVSLIVSIALTIILMCIKSYKSNKSKKNAQNSENIAS